MGQLGPGPWAQRANWDPGPMGHMGPGPNGPIWTRAQWAKWDPGPMGQLGPGPNCFRIFDYSLIYFFRYTVDVPTIAIARGGAVGFIVE